MPLHPEAEALLDALSQAGIPPFEHMTVPQAREAASAFIDLQGEAQDVAEVRQLTAPGPAGPIPLRLYRPSQEAGLPVIVYFHGGGWVIGDLDTVDKPLRALANRLGALVVSVDYRLAPEHPYPASFDDSYAATAWVAANAQGLGGDPGTVVVAGDSAGGTLAAAVSLAARDRNGPAIAGQFLIYPAVSFDLSTPSYQENAEGYLLQRASMSWFYAHYFGAQAGPPTDPYACPGAAADYTGLPPAFVATAGFDPLRDDGLGYAAKLEKAGVPVRAHHYGGMLHGFFWTLGATPSGAEILEDMAAALAEIRARPS